MKPHGMTRMIAVEFEEPEFDQSLLDVPLRTVGEILVILGAFQTVFLLATFATSLSGAWAIGAIWSGIGLLTSVCQTLGSVQMVRRRLYWWAIAGAVAAMLPFFCTWLLSAPLGVWALCLLSLREVREDFL